MRDPESLAKEKCTVCDAVEILYKNLEETNVRPSESLD